jgi:outer membrane receptor protein involved in Fe transport
MARLKSASFLFVILCTGLFGLFLLPESASFAQGTETPVIGVETFLFDEMVIAESTTKREEKTQESALNVRVITREDIENYGLTTMADLMMFLENSFETFKGRDRVYGVRGVMAYANDKIKFLIDGQEFPMMLGLGEGELPITLDEVKKIEIVKGPNTSLFGGNATQMTLNIIRYNGSDFVGLKTGAAIGSWNHKRGYLHYAEKPNNDFNYDVYFLTAEQKGPDVTHREWGGDTNYLMFKHDVKNPLPDYELIMASNYKDFRLMYRRVIERRNAYNDIYTFNYSDGIAGEFKKAKIFGYDSVDFVGSIEASSFGQQYDVYHADPSIGSPIEHKAEKRLEWDAHVYYHPEANWDLLAGLSGNYWQALGTEYGQFQTTSTRFTPGWPTAPQLYSSGITTPEWFPAFTEINDLADWEAWADFKYKFNDQFNIVLGGRYVYDFVPGNQLRDSGNEPSIFDTDRELLNQFFPKAALVYSPAKDLYIKFVYQEGFNRPNTFEQFAAWNTLPMRGTLKATTAKTYELILDWVLNKNMKTLVSIFSTNYYDFVNFAYTGTSWPTVNAAAGQVRGFINVGDQDTQGIEGNFELKYDNWGGFAGVGYMYKNEIKPFAQFGPNTAGTGATGIVNDGSDLNKQSFPEWNASFGAWMKVVENITLSTLYTTHQNIKTSEDWVSPFLEEELNSWDIILNAKDIGIKNLGAQLMCKNILDDDSFKGSAMDPAHREQQIPRYFEGKVVYLW